MGGRQALHVCTANVMWHLQVQQLKQDKQNLADQMQRQQQALQQAEQTGKSLSADKVPDWWHT